MREDNKINGPFEGDRLIGSFSARYGVDTNNGVKWRLFRTEDGTCYEIEQVGSYGVAGYTVHGQTRTDYACDDNARGDGWEVALREERR